MPMPANVQVSHHPLLLHKLTQVRSQETEPKAFRELLRDISRLLFYEATQDLDVRPWTVQTPLAPHEGVQIAQRIGLIPILRAGLGMAEAILDLLPTAHVWHLGLYRDHHTLQPVVYYNKLPEQAKIDLAIVLDPMLATGGSAVSAVASLKRWGARNIKYLGLIAAPEGVKALQTAHPDVPIHLGAIDSHLDEKCYIVPGLGDAGDRQFGTD
jgi:uracil phosphoribosyltransferase